MRPFLIALQFLTRLPVPLRQPPSAQEWGRSLLYYPLVGLLLGLLLAGLALALPSNTGALPAALLLVAWISLTGAFHLDGLADSADAWAGGAGDPERSLAIMKDPRCGPVGAVALMLVLLLKFAALDLAVGRGSLAPVILAPVLGRSAVVLLLLSTPYVRPGGLGEALARELPRRLALWVLGAVATAAALLAGWPALAGLLVATVTFAGLRWMLIRRIGGTTGDTAGALVELTECAALSGMLLV
ncbi:adenosylcobinamide-GDP ribazoletransferase [Methyloterricola oryzae]|uniref:adenosylcobinamide-GDP ribazoletransferase n=1 Tax=Methyloterricola oryzae TaxID=1495050 RepID=UPI0005EAF34D|nr:adenosylcobinamide-GDP ribazoletransferase [Methyloterricola oryzae]